MQLKSLFLIFIELSLVLTADKAKTIFIAGDSTAANKDLSNNNQERGWGQMFQNYFNKNFVVIDNRARGGRSSKSFIDEGLWDGILKDMKKGDYAIIQFGHNDGVEDAARHTDPGSTFEQYLTKYATDTIKHGGIPILMSPVSRRWWKKGKLVDSFGGYREGAKNVASQLKAHYVDANAITTKLINNLGDEGSKKLFMISAGKNDNTHFTIQGATTVAKLLAEAVIKEVPELAPYYKK